MKVIVLLILVLFSANSYAFLNYPINASTLFDRFMKSLRPSKSNNVDQYLVSGEECNRECKKNDIKICHFKWTMEHYHVFGGACNNCSKGVNEDCFHPQCITADGIERGLMTINRQLAGPPIHVCKDDVIVVDVINSMHGTATGIHWHGLNQKETPFMDGVPYVTQCPISYGSSFRYTFYAREAGTNFYHSHSGLQKANGIHGSLIIRAPKLSDDNTKEYDYDLSEHTIIAADWMHSYAEMYFPGLSSTLSLFQSILINGKGRFFNEETNEYSKAPLSVFHVKKGKRYRFRLINSASNVCPFLFQIEGHRMKVIASDSGNVKPFLADSLYLTSGERYDFVIDADKKQDEYWIRMRALEPCTHSQKIDAFAVLSYNDKIKSHKLAFPTKSPPIFENSYPLGVFLNNPKANKTTSETDVTVADLRSYVYDKELLHKKADYSYKLLIETPRIDNGFLYADKIHRKYMVTSAEESFNDVGTINNISLIMPKFPLLTQQGQINENMFCNESDERPEYCPADLDICFCTHRLKVKLNSIVEFYIVDLTDEMTHPFHVHGHKFVVTDIRMFDERITPETMFDSDISELDKSEYTKTYPYKDTVLVPNPGYARIRFRADNPGFWLVHCHFEWHLAIGMGLILQVGELNEMIKPPNDFPTCNEYVPEILV